MTWASALGDRASSGGELLGVREGAAVTRSICSSESIKTGGSQISVLLMSHYESNRRVMSSFDNENKLPL